MSARRGDEQRDSGTFKLGTSLVRNSERFVNVVRLNHLLRRATKEVTPDHAELVSSVRAHA